MTNGWIDIKNTDMMLIMGGNPAENHPCGFKWAIEAKRNRNAKMIVVDPRFTRTARGSDLFLQIRAGTDIAFLGGVIHYAIENNRIAKEYLVNFTNAAFIIKEGFKLPEDGLYSGFDEAPRPTTKPLGITQEGGNVTGRASVPRGDGTTGHRLTLVSHALLPAALPGKRRLRLDAPASALRLSAVEDSSIRATRRRWSSASPASRKTSS